MINLIEVKADILCNGILNTKTSEKIYKFQNPSQMHKQGRYFGVMIKLGEEIHILATVTHEVSENSKYKLTGDLNNVSLVDLNDNFICNVKYINPPNWYNEKTSTNKLTSEVFIDEGENYLHMTYSGCDYNKCNLKCKFCGTGGRINNSTPEEIAETIEFAKDERKYQVCLGGGTYLPLYKNTSKFKEIVKEIREKSSDIPIWIEMVPPTKKEIKELVDTRSNFFWV